MLERNKQGWVVAGATFEILLFRIVAVAGDYASKIYVGGTTRDKTSAGRSKLITISAYWIWSGATKKQTAASRIIILRKQDTTAS